MPSHRRRPVVILLVAAAAIVPVLASTAPVAAQGTSGMLPSPMTVRDLDRFADRLNLTADQRRALDEAHDEYHADFRTLRQGDIEQYLEEVRGLWSRGFRSLNREAIEASLTKLDRLMTRIRLLDDQLFDAMQSVMIDEQIAGLPRVMQTRDRQRYSSGGTQMVGRTPIPRLFISFCIAPIMA